MKTDVQRFLADLASDLQMQAVVKELGIDVAKIVHFANGRGYLFDADQLDDFADHYDRACDPMVFGLRRQGWHLKPQS